MFDYILLTAGDVHWRVRRDAKELVFTSDCAKISKWMETGQATVVKHGPHRTVYKLHVDNRSFYLKHFRVPDTQALLSQWVQRSKGRREWEMLRCAASHKVPTSLPVALGEQRKKGVVLNNYLITEGLDQVEALPDFALRVLPGLPQDRQSHIRNESIESVAHMLARTHIAGIHHRDMHAGNLLLQMDPNNRVQLFVIDLDAARIHKRMNWRRSKADLMTLAISCLKYTSATDRMRFLRRYVALRPDLQRNFQAVARELSPKILRGARASYWRRNARCVSDNRRFFYRDIGTAHGSAVKDLIEPVLMSLLRDPDYPLNVQKNNIIKVKKRKNT